MAQINFTDIHKILQEIHENRDHSLYGGFYTTLTNGSCNSLWSSDLALKGVKELNKRNWSDFGITPDVYSLTWVCGGVSDSITTEASVDLSTESGEILTI